MPGKRNLSIIVLVISLTLILLSFFQAPQTVAAHPPVGLTITPTAINTPVPPTPNSDPDPDPNPSIFIPVQLGCTLTVCGVGGQPVNAQIDVQFIHPETGWIAAATISNQQTNVSVPYPGQWEIYMVSPPRYASTGDILPIGELPQKIGMAWTGNDLQMVTCPLNCSETPAALPQTGDSGEIAETGVVGGLWYLIGLFVASVLVLIVAGGYALYGRGNSG